MVRDRLIRDRRPALAFLAAAALANLIAIGAGLAAGLSYLTGTYPTVAAAFRQHRAVHVLFAIAWIYLAGVAALYHAMSAHPPPGFRRRARWHLGLWALAGVGSLVSLSQGQFSGRPYLEAPAVWSLAVLAGWLPLARSFQEWLRARREPLGVRHYMWGMSLALFVAAFAEAHFHLIPALSARPVRDIGVQWKSYGTLVGTFNLLVYAGVSYVGTLRASGPETATGIALFLVGALNTFTNYGHHTFHVAQSAWVQWAGFLVSCTEIAIVAALLGELLGARPQAIDATARWLRWGRFWSFVMVTLAILLSIPPLNTLAHGTYLVMAHAMGSMIGIDTVLLLACTAELLKGHIGAGALESRWTSGLVNGGLALILVALIARGSADAVLRALGPLSPAPPDALRLWQPAFVCGGAAVAVGLALVDLAVLSRVRRIFWPPMVRTLHRVESHVHEAPSRESRCSTSR